MTSIQARVIRVAVRMTSSLVPSYSPIRYQRFMFSDVAPRMVPARTACDFKRAADCVVPASWLVPPGADDDRAVLYLHGGSYMNGKIETYRKMVAQIAEAVGCRALLIGYRLAPECEFPGAVEDAVAAYRWLLSQGYDPANVVVAGDSAGGGLTVAMLLSLRDSGEPLPAAAVMISPWTDLEVAGDSVESRAKKDPLLSAGDLRKWSGMYVGGGNPRAPLMSPIHADLSGLPQMLVQVGSDEILLDDARRLAERAEKNSVPVELEVWDGMWHVWQFFSPLVPESKKAIARIGEYCRLAFKD